MKSAPSVTSLAETGDIERRRRMRNYAITMGIRTACFLSLAFVRGWWMFIPAIGAIVLPYIAVVFANVATKRDSDSIESPGRNALGSEVPNPAEDAPNGSRAVVIEPRAIEPPRDRE